MLEGTQTKPWSPPSSRLYQGGNNRRMKGPVKVVGRQPRTMPGASRHTRRFPPCMHAPRGRSLACNIIRARHRGNPPCNITSILSPPRDLYIAITFDSSSPMHWCHYEGEYFQKHGNFFSNVLLSCSLKNVAPCNGDLRFVSST